MRKKGLRYCSARQAQHACTKKSQRLQCLLTVHDEVVVLCPETSVSDDMPWVYDQMVADPEYMPGIPLKADIDAAVRYGDAK